MQAFEGRSANDVWLKAAAMLRGIADRPLQQGRGGATNEALHVALEIQDPLQRWVVNRVPAMSVAFAIVEVIGIISGRRDSKYLNFFNKKLPDLAGHGPEYHGAYGHRIRANLGFDQLDRAYSALLRNPHGRQVVLQIWDSTQDFPKADGMPVSEDIPCNVCSMLKIRSGKLEWAQIMRSNDLFKGLPYNFVQFTSLQEVVAGWLGVAVGRYCHYSDSLHLYSEDIEQAFRHDDAKAEENSDSLALPREESDQIWREMNRRVDILVATGLEAKAYERIAQLEPAPTGFGNLMRVVTAEASRRHGFVDLPFEIMEKCTNPVLKQLWTRWAERRKAVRSGSASVTEETTADTA